MALAYAARGGSRIGMSSGTGGFSIEMEARVSTGRVGAKGGGRRFGRFQ